MIALLALVLAADTTGGAGFRVKLPDGFVVKKPSETPGTDNEVDSTVGHDGLFLESQVGPSETRGNTTSVILVSVVEADPKACAKLALAQHRDTWTVETPLGTACVVQAPFGSSVRAKRRHTQHRKAIVPFTHTQSLQVNCIDVRNEARTFAACDEVLRSISAAR